MLGEELLSQLSDLGIEALIDDIISDGVHDLVAALGDQGQVCQWRQALLKLPDRLLVPAHLGLNAIFALEELSHGCCRLLLDQVEHRLLIWSVRAALRVAIKSAAIETLDNRRTVTLNHTLLICLYWEVFSNFYKFLFYLRRYHF